MSKRPHIILIITDQQRADTIGALGAPWMHTPALDRMAREGAAFTNCFVTSPVCVGSRASLFTGMYPHAGGVFTNFHPWEPNWVRWLAEAGYHCANIGKMHINPYDASGGFHQRFVVENKDRPLFLQIGFPGPHPPYDPVARHLARYAATELALPSTSAEEIALQPRSQGELRRNMIRNNYDSVAWQENPSREALLRLRRHYAANVSMIDEKVAQIMETLARKGYLEDAIVVFTSDHADSLGDHGHIQKWTMYDCVTRVPLIVWSPSRIKGGMAVDSPVQLMDVAPTVLEAAGVPVPANWESRTLMPLCTGRSDAIRDVVFSELARDHIQSGAEYIIMRRDREWKLVYYLGEPDGELFALAGDPGETSNLWHSAAHREQRDRLVHEVLEWSMRSTLRSRMQATRKPQQPMLVEEPKS